MAALSSSVASFALSGTRVEDLNGRAKTVAPDAIKSSNIRVKEMLNKVELSVSSYDTAWVAMVPSLDSSNQPCFPQSLKWVMENQQSDGSWCLDPTHPLLIKDSLSSTLACVLALQTWNLGQQLVHKGLDFIGSNIWAATDTHQPSPIGFDIIFPSMIQYANNMGLNPSLDHFLMQEMLHNRDLEMQIMSFINDKVEGVNKLPRNIQPEANRKQTKEKPVCYNTWNQGRTKSHYPENKRRPKKKNEPDRTAPSYRTKAEGLILESTDWNEVMKYQRRNGSILNSPSTTAAALIHLRDGQCFHYLDSLLKIFKNGVPTIYPFNIYARLSLIDELEKLGVEKHMKKEKETVLGDIYRCWIQGSEEIFLDPRCCAMAFRLLRMNGYDIYSDALANFEEENLLDAKDTKAVLELFKASQVTIFQNEPILERIYTWSQAYLKEELVNGAISEKSLQNEVDYALKHPYASLKSIENRNFIENYNTDKISLLKTHSRFINIDERNLLALSSQHFNNCQSILQKELAYLESWEKKYGLDKLKFARQKLKYAYFSVASNLFEPEFSDARLSWTQNTIVTTVFDDFFEYFGSMEELLNLINLVERWDEHESVGFMTKEVEILFNAVYGLVNELADKAQKYQGRSVKSHLIDIWISMLYAMLKEAEYARENIVPTIDEYTSVGCTSVGFGPIILIALYFLEKMSEEVVQSEEYQNLNMHTSLLGRLINDRVTAKSDLEQGKLNSVSLRVVHSNGAITEEEAKEEVSRIIEKHRRELLGMVLKTEESIVPKVCKDLFWMTSKDLHLFYSSEDGYSSPTKMVGAVNAVIDLPIIMPTYAY